jgi:hypothetical protein
MPASKLIGMQQHLRVKAVQHSWPHCLATAQICTVTPLQRNTSEYITTLCEMHCWHGMSMYERRQLPRPLVI